MTFPHTTLPGSRDPGSLLEQTRKGWGGDGDLWVFGYASLIWRPEFDAAEQRAGHGHGWHRALQMRSRVNRGTPECPGLVFALVPRRLVPRRGLPHRSAHEAEAQLERLWAREMPTGVYDPKWLRCRTAAAAASRALGVHAEPPQPEPHRAAAGRADDRHPAHAPTAATAARSPIWWRRRASLRDCGIRDRDVERLVALARRHALTA